MDDDVVAGRARVNAIGMVQQRGYTVHVGTDRDVHFARGDHGTLPHVYLFEIRKRKMGIKELRDVRTAVEQNGGTHAIVVYAGACTPFAKTDAGKVSDVEFELFHVDRLQFNLLEHTLIPQHTVVPSCARQATLQRLHATPDQLPQLSHNDPVVKWLHLKRGTLVRIESTSPECHSFFDYRIVR